MTGFLSTLRARYGSFQPFTDQEAWAVFRLAAIAEAVGWTMLIIGIACKQLPVSYNEVPVQIAGRIHGVLFLLYIVAVIVVAPSLRWGWIRVLVAGAASMPPYGSLVFEHITGHFRTWQEFRQLRGVVGYAIASSRLY